MQLPNNALLRASLVVALGTWAIVAFALAAHEESTVSKRAAGHCVPAFLGAVATVVVAALAQTSEALCASAACIALLAVAPADARLGYIFDAVMLPAVALSIVLSAMLGTLESALVGAVTLSGLFGSIWLASRGRWLGLGDVKAVYLVGVAFGPVRALLVVLMACLSGIATATAGARLRRRNELAFAPHLAAASLAALLWGPTLASWLGFPP